MTRAAVDAGPAEPARVEKLQSDGGTGSAKLGDGGAPAAFPATAPLPGDGGVSADGGTRPDGGPQLDGGLPTPPVARVDSHPPAAPEPAEVDTPGLVIRTLLGLLLLLGLAYLGGHPIVRLWERRLGIAQVITAGLPFVLLGLAAGSPKIGVLSVKVIEMIDPVLRMSLGWIGLIIGFRFEASVLGSSQRISRLLTTRVVLSFLCIVSSTAVVLLGTSGFSLQALLDLEFLRDALILGSAGALMSLITPQLLRARGCDEDSINVVGKLVRLQEFMGVIGLLFIAAYFRPPVDTTTWILPGTAWVLLTLGLGTGVGIVMYAVLQRDHAGVGEAMVMLLGSVAFSAGMATSLHLSPVVVCFVAGALLSNFPGDYKQRVRDTLLRLERPIYLLFLLIVGSQWQVHDRRGWLLMAVFVLARLFGNWLGTRVALRTAHVPLSRAAQQALSVSPMGALSIAIVVNARLLYPSTNSSALVTAIVGGAIMTELIVQLITRAGSPDVAEPPASEAGSRIVTALLLILLLSSLMYTARSYSVDGVGSGVNAAQALGYLMLAAFFAGNFVKRLRLPKLTGYLAIGIIAGPPVLNLVSAAALERLKLISGLATALIALSAGAEMELRTMRPLIRSVFWISTIAILGTMTILSGTIFLFRPFLPFLRELPIHHAAIVSVILGVVMSAQSPAVVMALRTETGAEGPLMRTVLGVVVLGDFLVILIFAVVSTIGQAIFGGKADLVAVTRSLSWELLGSMVAGVIAGLALWVYLKKVKGTGSLFILVVCVVIAEVGHRLHFDPLLVALAAGVFIRNVTSVGDDLHKGINASLLPVYVVFFSVAGATIHFAVLASVWAPALVFIVVRALGFLGGARIGAAIADAPPTVRRYAGFGLLPQAGLALALSLLFARTFPQFGAAAGALTLGVVALNEILAPALFRAALLRSGESQLPAIPAATSAPDIIPTATATPPPTTPEPSTAG